MFFYEVSLFQFLKVNWFKGKWKKKKESYNYVGCRRMIEDREMLFKRMNIDKQKEGKSIFYV